VQLSKEHEKIYEDLKEKIIWLDLKPESVLNVSELAGHYRVSRTPLKEALILLQAEGWVLRQGSYFLVTPLSLDRLKETTEIRMIMEIQGNILASQRITQEELVSLKTMLSNFAKKAQKAGNKETVELDFAIHKSIFVASRNTQMAQLLERLLNQYLRFWLSAPREIDKVFFVDSLTKLIAAIEKKDINWLIEVSRGHILDSVREIARYQVEPALSDAAFSLSGSQ